MRNLRLFALFLSLAASAFATFASAEVQTYASPKVGSQPLDLCLNWGADCGKPAADAWCVSIGFTESTGHVVANDIGASTPTRLISSGAVCDQAFCDGFASISCFKPDTVEKVFTKPKLNGKRLDLCVNWGQGCGEPAATLFCQSAGWSFASDFVVANDIGSNSPTRLIGTGAICDQSFCDGFSTITCKN